MSIPVEYFGIRAVLEGRFTSEKFGRAVLALRKIQEIMTHSREEIEISIRCENVK